MSTFVGNDKPSMGLDVDEIEKQSGRIPSGQPARLDGWVCEGQMAFDDLIEDADPAKTPECAGSPPTRRTPASSG